MAIREAVKHLWVIGGSGVPVASSLSFSPHYFLKRAQILLKGRIATIY